MQEYYRRRQISSCELRRRFLRDCQEEQVLPSCGPKHLLTGGKVFSESARIYLDEACEELSNRIEELKNETSETVIPGHLMRRLSREQRESKMRS